SIITLAPGPDNMMVLGIGISKGRLQGIMFGLGCAIGCLSHTLLAVLGISALIAGSPSAYMALKMCGGLYLGWLGFQSLRSTLNQFGSPSENGAVQTSAPLFIKGTAGCRYDTQRIGRGHVYRVGDPPHAGLIQTKRSLHLL